MNNTSIKLLKSSFKKYYFEHFNLIHVPKNSSEREFAYKNFDSKIYRHIALNSDEDLHLLLMTNVPSDMYCSNAYYLFPHLSMVEKDWKGADLIFDIDSKDLKLDCRQSHTCIKCFNCNKVSSAQSRCSKCNSNKIQNITLLCKNCINEAKKEVKKLLIILTDDLGIENKNISVYFSGNDGFHLCIDNIYYQKLGSMERADLVDYILLRDMLPGTINKINSLFSDIAKQGLIGRINKHLKHKDLKTSHKVIEPNSFDHRLENLKHILKSNIDPNVTIDIHRVFRLEGSLNSKSSLAKILCKDLKKFNPLLDACFIDNDMTKIVATCPITFTLKNRKFGPFENEDIVVPKYVATYMICKGLAEAV